MQLINTAEFLAPTFLKQLVKTSEIFLGIDLHQTFLKPFTSKLHCFLSLIKKFRPPKRRVFHALKQSLNRL